MKKIKKILAAVLIPACLLAACSSPLEGKGIKPPEPSMLSFTVYDAGTFAQACAAVNGDMNEAGGFYTITVTGSF